MTARVTSEQLVGAFKARGLAYVAIYREMAAELGAERATEIMKRAIYKRGLEVGKQFAKYAPGDLQGLRDAFLAFIPDPEHTFKPEVVRCDDQELEFRFFGCPLRDSWAEAGLSEEEMEHICSMAGVVDNGTFEGAGFEFAAEPWHECADGCCHLHVRPGKAKKG